MSQVVRRERWHPGRDARPRDSGAEPVAAEPLDHPPLRGPVFARHKRQDGLEDDRRHRNPPAVSRSSLRPARRASGTVARRRRPTGGPRAHRAASRSHRARSTAARTSQAAHRGPPGRRLRSAARSLTLPPAGAAPSPCRETGCPIRRYPRSRESSRRQGDSRRRRGGVVGATSSPVVACHGDTGSRCECRSLKARKSPTRIIMFQPIGGRYAVRFVLVSRATRSAFALRARRPAGESRQRHCFRRKVMNGSSARRGTLCSPR